MPDYSEFQRVVAINCKIKQFLHEPTGEIKLEFEVMLPAGMENYAKAIRDGFDALMSSLMGDKPHLIQSYFGQDAIDHDVPLEQYFAKDSKNSN